MKGLKKFLIVFTLVLSIVGVAFVTGNAKKADKVRANAIVDHSAAVASSSVAFSPTPMPTPDITQAAVPVELMEAEVIEVERLETVAASDDAIVIPEIVVADVNDEEDNQKNTRTPQSTETAFIPTQAPTATPAPVTEATATPAPVIASTLPIGTMYGIDVSAAQGSINWAKVKAAGVKFAMIRVGFRGWGSAGNLKVDSYFTANMEGALSNGIMVGVYIYSEAVTEAEAKQEAAWVCELLKPYKGRITLPVAWDFEDHPQYCPTNHRVYGMSLAQCNKNGRVFMDYVKSQGYIPCLYGNKNFMKTVWDYSKFSDCFIWLAHYTKNGLNSWTDYKGVYHMWQYSDNGRVDGISTAVDLNVYTYTGGVAAPVAVATATPTPTSTPTPTTAPEITPELTPEITPEVTPEITPEISPAESSGDPAVTGTAN